MAANKKSFLLYCDQIGMFEKLPDDVAGRLIKHIFRYTNDLDPETDELLVDALFEPIKSQLKRDLKVYESICERNRKNGAKGGRPKKPTAKPSNPKNPVGCLGNPEKPKEADTDNDTDTDTDNEIDTKIILPTSPKGEEQEVYITKKKKKLSGKRLETFNIFWDKFNYKSGKAAAADSWLNIGMLNESICCVIYKSAELEAEKRSTLLENGSTPIMAEGWITAKRWEDEQTVTKKQTSNII